MPRNISFAFTTEQIRNQSKTVTRRLGWLNLKPGEILNACVNQARWNALIVEEFLSVKDASIVTTTIGSMTTMTTMTKTGKKTKTIGPM